MFRLLFISLWMQNDLVSGWQPPAPSERFCDGQSCYNVQLGRMDFGTAAETCEKKGGSLTSMKSNQEAASIQKLLLGDPHVTFPANIWIGLKKPAKSCYHANKQLRGYSWINGDTFSNYTAWLGEPFKTCTHRLCVFLQANLTGSQQIHFGWIHVKCDKKSSGFICKFVRPLGTCEVLQVADGTGVSYTGPDGSERSVPLPSGLPQGSAAVVSCANGKSVSLKCEQRKGGVRWSRESPTTLCNKCEQGPDGCQYGCFNGGEGFYCYCDRGFVVDQGQNRCVAELQSEGSPITTKAQVKGTEPLGGNSSDATRVSPPSATQPSAPPSPGPAGHPGAGFSPTPPGQDRGTGSHPNRLFVPVIIGVSVLLLLIVIVVVVFKCCFRKRGAKQRRPQAPQPAASPGYRGSLLLRVKSTDSEENAGPTTDGMVANQNDYVETPSATGDNQSNGPKVNGELSEPTAR